MTLCRDIKASCSPERTGSQLQGAGCHQRKAKELHASKLVSMNTFVMCLSSVGLYS